MVIKIQHIIFLAFKYSSLFYSGLRYITKPSGNQIPVAGHPNLRIYSQRYLNRWSTKTGYKIYAKGAVKHKDVTKLCSTECLNELFGNNQCEQQCNKVGCAWDGDDCDGVVPPGGITDHRAGFYQSLDFVNILYEIKLVQDEPRYCKKQLNRFPLNFNLKYNRTFQQ